MDSPGAGPSLDKCVHLKRNFEQPWHTVNAWIRAAGNFDAVIDLDAAVRDPSKPDTLLPAYDTGDQLHLNPAGYKKMAEVVDLSLFAR
jgi:lysophospholipase L1-like esterase